MKKLLSLLLVLGLASIANGLATTLQISVNGDKEPLDSEWIIIEVPSGMLTLDIWTTADISAGVNEGYFALTCLIVKGTITGGVSQFPTEPGLAIMDDAVGNGVPVPQGENGVWGLVSTTGVIPLFPAGSTLFDLINFHCEGAGDAIIRLWEVSGDPILLDTVVIHQIPEPASMLLLGLGGLLLRRRK